MSINNISQVADLLRPASKELSSSKKGKLCLSINYLHKLNYALKDTSYEDENNTFNSLQNTKANLIRDKQFLCSLVKTTKSLKIITDIVNGCSEVDVSAFKTLEILEIQKVSVGMIAGIDGLRNRLYEITCNHSVNCISDFLDKCGYDNTQPYLWSELKKANFSHNKIVELSDSFEYTPWLHTLDLSHNEINNVEVLNRLQNLKYLNLSYNKLDCVPFFKGQICKRLQILILKNNFIEELSGLNTLFNLVQLDLSQNCILDHKSLLSVSHLASLQFLNLLGNPLSFHPHHRSQTCNYLNKNTSSVKFVLDNQVLTKNECSLVGTFHPITQISSLTSSTNSLLEGSVSMASDRPKRVRNVVIEDDTVVKKEKPVVSQSLPSTQHLEIKKQVEQLRQEYGESWLNLPSGLLDVLGIKSTTDFEKPLLSSTPFDSLETPYETAYDSSDLIKNEQNESTTTKFETATDESTPTVFDTNVENNSETSDDEEEDVDGEESIFFATIQGEHEQVLVVISKTHLSERESTTSKEIDKWHLSTIQNCESNENDLIKLEFDTMRKDRKQRIYQFENGEGKSFCDIIKLNKNKIKPIEQDIVTYQCMKCMELFTLNKNCVRNVQNIDCRSCGSNLVVENN